MFGSKKKISADVRRTQFTTLIARDVVIDGDLSQIDHIHNVVAVVKEGALVFEKSAAGT